MARELLLSNGLARDRVVLLEADGSGHFDVNHKLDLIVSLRSWGFHYPIPVYLERVVANMADGGVLITDIRRGTAGVDQLRNAFEELAIISSQQSDLTVCAPRSHDGLALARSSRRERVDGCG